MDAAEKDGHVEVRLDIAGYIEGVLVLVGEDGEAYDVGLESEDVMPDPIHVHGIAQLIVDVEEPRLDAPRPEEPRDIGDAVIEPHLGVDVGIDEEKAHTFKPLS